VKMHSKSVIESHKAISREPGQAIYRPQSNTKKLGTPHPALIMNDADLGRPNPTNSLTSKIFNVDQKFRVPLNAPKIPYNPSGPPRIPSMLIEGTKGRVACIRAKLSSIHAHEKSICANRKTSAIQPQIRPIDGNSDPDMRGRILRAVRLNHAREADRLEEAKSRLRSRCHLHEDEYRKELQAVNQRLRYRRPLLMTHSN